MLNAGQVATIWETELLYGADLPFQSITLNRNQLDMDQLIELLASALFPGMDADRQIAMFTEAFQMRTDFPGSFGVLRLGAEEDGMTWSKEEMDARSDALIDAILPWTGFTGYSVCRTEYTDGIRESVYLLEWNETSLYEGFYSTGTDSGAQGPYLRVTVDPYGVEEIFAMSLGRPSSDSAPLSVEDMVSIETVAQVCEAYIFSYGDPTVQVVNAAELIYYPVDDDGSFHVAWRVETTQYAYGSDGNLVSFQISILIDAVTGNLIGW